jgi:hypothetical protein
MSRKNKVEMPKRRNAIAFLAHTRFRSAVFDHKTEAQGGATNDSRNYFDEYCTDDLDNARSFWDD